MRKTGIIVVNILIIGLVAGSLKCTGDRMSLPREVAETEKPAPSPSGKYYLNVLTGTEGRHLLQSFQIKDREGDTLFQCEEWFDRRHTLYFLWDREDRVWVYSGDLGTFFWEKEAGQSKWVKKVYAKSDVSAPDFLKQVRPEWHQK